jgi:hypothetical protein
MAASSRLMITEAERRFPVRIKLAPPAGGLGKRLDQMHAWLDENCGADGWAMTPSGLRGVINDAVAIYFLDPTTAAGFVARWRAGSKFETAKGAFSGSARIRQRRELVWQHAGRRDRIGQWRTCNRCRCPTRPVRVLVGGGIPVGNLFQLPLAPPNRPRAL